MCIDYDFVPKTWAGESCTGGGLNWSSPVIVEIAPVYSAKNMCMWLKHTKNQKGGGGGGAENCWKIKNYIPSKNPVPPPPCSLVKILFLQLHPSIPMWHHNCELQINTQRKHNATHIQRLQHICVLVWPTGVVGVKKNLMLAMGLVLLRVSV